MAETTAFAVLVMGVAGSGKSTVGEGLAAALGVAFFDADAFHPPANVERMARAIPLTDDDRAPWLAALADLLGGRLAAGESTVLACSALKRRYRDRLRAACPTLAFVFLKGDEALLAERMRGRRGHFMPTELLRSQLDTLEPPGPDEVALALDIARPPAALIAEAAAFAGRLPSAGTRR